MHPTRPLTERPGFFLLSDRAKARIADFALSTKWFAVVMRRVILIVERFNRFATSVCHSPTPSHGPEGSTPSLPALSRPDSGEDSVR